MAKIKGNKRKSQKKINYLIAIAVVFISFIGSLLWPDLFSVSKGMPDEAKTAATKVHVIDVGQGDAVLLEDNGKFALIDAGEKTSQDLLVKYLKNAKVTTLDYMIMTHPHSDHIGGMSEVINNFKVEKMLFPQFEKAPISTTSIFEKLLDDIEQSNIPTEIMKKGDTFALGNAVINVLSDGVKSDNQNNISPAILFEANGLKYLSTGDGEKISEKDIIETVKSVNVDIFKAAHHGSDTSNTQDFLTHMRPKFVAISVGEQNAYGHPSQKVLNTLNDLSINYMRTDINGTIIVYVNPENKTSVVSLNK